MLSSLALLLCAHAAGIKAYKVVDITVRLVPRGEPFTVAVPTLPDRSRLYLQYNPDFHLFFVVFQITIPDPLVVSSEIYSRSHQNNVRISGKTESPGCLYEGLWYAAGSAVRTREVCLACACAQGALSCRRRTCAPQPEPPSRCHVVHRRGDCCPELHCPDGIRYLDQTASGRFDDSNIEMPSSIGHACVEGGTVYAAGSAMSSNIACEQCFCLGGMRRCVRPRCLPPPPGCTARPTSGACCPQRYYCEHGSITKPPSEKNSHDCVTPKGNWVNEGGRVKESEIGSKCIQCFCLHGSIRCQHLSCAPKLQGCKPLVQPGQCCAHQYSCDHHINDTKLQNLSQQRQNMLLLSKDEARSFHTSKSTKRESTTLENLTVVTDKTTPAITVTKEETIKSSTKVKRKTDDIQVVLDKADTTKMMTVQTTNDFTTTNIESTTEMLLEKTVQEITTEQPEGSVRIIINGTINCTSELSSTALLLNMTHFNDTMWDKSEAQARIPLIDKYDNAEHTFFQNDIITEGSYNANFDENETFNINVTTSLNANSTRTVTTTAVPKIVLPTLLNNVNISKIKKEEFDYDYTEPTLPPSLPNLKIIPFVAADAVVDDELSSKEISNYPVLEKEDKFPVYYPTKHPKETIFAMRKEDIYNNTHYSAYAPDIETKDEPQYPGIIEDESTVNIAYPSITNDFPPDVHEYTVTASFGNPAKFNSNIKSESNSVAKFEIETPAVNLFSPPAETEGGFVPKDPDLNEDFYSVYQSTSLRPLPHLTTSMQLETKDECISSDGRQIREGETISFACSLCSCEWGELHCSPRPCNTPPGCKRLTATKNTADLCCGELICDYNDKTTKKPLISPSDFKISLNETKVPSLIENKEMVNVTRQDNKSFDSDVSYNNKTIPDIVTPGNFSSIYNQTFQATGNKYPTKSIISEEATIKTPTTETITAASNHSLDYEDEDDDDDEGFSLGSVLKLLLSETYESTTTAPPKKKQTTVQHTSKIVVSTLAPTTIRKPSTISDNKFVPVTHHYPYVHNKQPIHPFNTVDRIDHLVLGEASAIRKPSTQPAVTFKPVTFTTTRKILTTKTTQRPVSTNSVEITSKEGFLSQSSEVDIRPPSNFLSGFGLGLPKLAGCNIYGRMYRVGRIIAELSSPCQECKCTELGVQCRSLGC